MLHMWLRKEVPFQKKIMFFEFINSLISKNKDKKIYKVRLYEFLFNENIVCIVFYVWISKIKHIAKKSEKKFKRLKEWKIK